MADDGHEYDFDRIKAYIRQHMDSALLSPVTGEPMTGQVYFTEPVKDRTGQIIYTGKGVDRVPKVIVRAWQPTLNLPTACVLPHLCHSRPRGRSRLLDVALLGRVRVRFR